MKELELGTGALTWSGGERRSDRYGSVWLTKENENSLSQASEGSQLKKVDLPKRARLVAYVLVTRESTHIGDFVRDIFPETPNVGDKIVLSEMGTPEFEDIPGGYGLCIAIKPDDGRKTDWLDPHQLYRAHEQTVRLVLETE